MSIVRHCALVLIAVFAIVVFAARPPFAAQFAEDVSAACSLSHQGPLLYTECDTTIAYMDPETSEVYYCDGHHQVVTHGSTVQRFSISAECILMFRPFTTPGNYVFLDVTEGLLPKTTASSANLYPEAIAWIVGKAAHELQYCSSFMAGQAQIQSRCVVAAFK